MIYFIVAIIVLAVIATLPAGIAKRKGRDYATWYIYGIFFWIVAMLHAISLPETNQQNDLNLANVNNEDGKAELKTIDLNSPIQIHEYNLLTNNDGTVFLNIVFQKLIAEPIVAIRLEVAYMNSFHDPIYINGLEKTELIIQDLEEGEDPYSPFICNQRPIELPDNSIRDINLSIVQVKLNNNETISVHEHRYIKDYLGRPMTLEHKAESYQFLPIAHFYAEQKKDFWICACGCINEGDTCQFCLTEKSLVFDKLCEENLNRLSINRKLSERKALKRTGIVLASMVGIMIIIGVIIYNLPSTRYDRASDFYTKKEYNKAENIYIKLKEYKDAPQKAVECQYQRASLLVSGKTLDKYKEALDILGRCSFKTPEIEKLEKDCKYQFAEEIVLNNKFEHASEAIAFLEEIGKYQNAENYLHLLKWDGLWTCENGWNIFVCYDTVYCYAEDKGPTTNWWNVEEKDNKLIPQYIKPSIMEDNYSEQELKEQNIVINSTFEYIEKDKIQRTYNDEKYIYTRVRYNERKWKNK